MRFPDDVPTLTDGDVTLRAPRLEDADAVVEQCTDPVSLQWTTVPVGYDHEMAVDWLTGSIPQRWQSGSERIFAIETTHPDGRRRFSGSVSLRDEGERRAEIAYGAHPAVRGRGVTATAVNLLLDYGFGSCDLETVLWWANVGNVASRRLAWKVGFTFGGVVRRWLPQREEYLDGWVGSLHRSDARAPTTSWLDVPVIAGEAVRLRPLHDSDVDRLVEAARDERSQHWLAFMPSPYDDADARDFLARCAAAAAEGQGLTWAIADPGSDRLLGNIGLRLLSRDAGWEVGFLTHPDARGRGVMQAACRLATRHVLTGTDAGGLGASRAVVQAAAGNAASQHVARANGYTEYGRERESQRLRDGSVTDMVLFDVLAREWDAGAGRAEDRR
jgi:RimJ/RimL family protein N-acetyltransferase